MQERLIFLIAGCAILGFAAWFAFRPDGTGRAEAASEPTAVRVRVLERGSVSHSQAFAGQSQHYLGIDAHVSCFIRSIKVDIGDRVRQGQTLAVLEVPQWRAQLEGTAQVARSEDEQTIRCQTTQTCSLFVLHEPDCVLFPSFLNSYLISPNTQKLKHPASSIKPATAWRALRRGMFSAMLAPPIINP